MKTAISLLMALSGLASLPIAIAHSSELTVFSPGALRTTMSEVIPPFESTTGHKIKIQFGSTRQLYKRLQAGDSADIVILTSAQIHELQSANRVAPTDIFKLPKIGIGGAVRIEGRQFTIPTIDDLKASLQRASSIGSVDPEVGVAGRYLSQLLSKLLRNPEIKAKMWQYPPGSALYQAIASGDPEIEFAPISEILTRRTLRYLGPLPKEVQRYNIFSTAILKSTNEYRSARELITYLRSSGVTRTLG